MLSIFKTEKINVEYVYAFTGSAQGDAYVVLRVDELEKAESILAQNNIKTLNDSDITDYLK